MLSSDMHMFVWPSGLPRIVTFQRSHLKWLFGGTRVVVGDTTLFKKGALTFGRNSATRVGVCFCRLQRCSETFREVSSKITPDV